MKWTGLLAVALSLAPIASATWYPAADPRFLQVEVGQTRTITVRALWSGIWDPGWHDWEVQSSNPRVATASGWVTSPGYPIDVPVTGVAPGQAFLWIHPWDGQYATIEVVCGKEDPVVPAEAVVVTAIGKKVTLRVATPIAHRTTFVWYRGQTGDHSSPLPQSGPELSVTPAVPGEFRYWVLAKTPCSSSTAEFRIEAHGPRRQTVRR